MRFGAIPPSLPASMSSGDVTRLASNLAALLPKTSASDKHAGTRAYRLAAYAAGAAACATAGRFRVTDVARAAPDDLHPRRLRRVLDDGQFPEDLLVLALAAGAPFSEVSALVVEHSEMVEGPRRFDVVAITAVGARICQPLTIRRALAGGDVGADEASLVAGAVWEVSDAYSMTEFGSLHDIPPFVTVQRILGENDAVRGALRGCVPEYALEVDGDYDDIVSVRLPYDPLDEHRCVADLFEGWPEGTESAPPRELAADDIRRGREFSVMLPGDVPRRFAVARPVVTAQARELLGRRPDVRAAELAALAARVDAPAMASRLGATNFIHSCEQGWRRGTLLLAFTAAYTSGKLPADLPALARLS